MRTTRIPKPARPPMAIPTIAPVDNEVPLLDPTSEGPVSEGKGSTVEVMSVEGLDPSSEESVLGEGARIGDLSVTMVVFLVMVTLE